MNDHTPLEGVPTGLCVMNVTQDERCWELLGPSATTTVLLPNGDRWEVCATHLPLAQRMAMDMADALRTTDGDTEEALGLLSLTYKYICDQHEEA